MSYTPVSMSLKEQFQTCWNATPQHSIDYTLANLWGWGPYFGLEWEFDGALCWLRQTRPAPMRWAPLGDWTAVDWAADPVLARGGMFIRVPEMLARIWKDALGERVQMDEARGHWEYLYRRDNLVTLPGKKLHKKKTHVNGYIKEYGTPDYRSLDSEAGIDDVLELQDEWC